MNHTTRHTFDQVKTLDDLRRIVLATDLWPAESTLTLSGVQQDRGYGVDYSISISYQEKA